MSTSQFICRSLLCKYLFFRAPLVICTLQKLQVLSLIDVFVLIFGVKLIKMNDDFCHTACA